MTERNPYAISFGRIPTQYISRDIIIDEIVSAFNSDIAEEQAFKITGIRGTGKTVTLTAIEKELSEQGEWIIVNLKPGAEITNDLVAKLYTEVPFITSYVDANLNLSAFGIGLNLKKKSPAASLDLVLEELLEVINKQKKRVLVTIDEVRKTDALVDFIQEYQILIRKDLPVYLLVAGLYEDIEDIENTDGLTFFLRATKYEMTPLNIGVIREDYKLTMGLSDDVAYELAVMTKGYAFAYQAFGKYMWDSKSKEITPMVLAKVDDALAQKVYDKIWSELPPKDKWYLSFIVQKDNMDASELLELTKKSHSDWSEPRRRLIEKGVIDGSIRGKIVLRLPRFKEYVDSKQF
ncbi:ATP-binding protein [Butyrivibrio sp. XPD2006]|jgi:ribosome-associated translation inhibitor RaiA|uniref:ATP-binding protein n=1 Tax=Butyrivibrio sp. XPD2006 TaxID=1280668 RepID=UPI0003B332B5|nr:ATP-binding protein [Butyrivibrio sp. XPD2006]